MPCCCTPHRTRRCRASTRGSPTWDSRGRARGMPMSTPRARGRRSDLVLARSLRSPTRARRNPLRERRPRKWSRRMCLVWRQAPGHCRPRSTAPAASMAEAAAEAAAEETAVAEAAAGAQPLRTECCRCQRRCSRMSGCICRSRRYLRRYCLLNTRRSWRSTGHREYSSRVGSSRTGSRGRSTRTTLTKAAATWAEAARAAWGA